MRESMRRLKDSSMRWLTVVVAAVVLSGVFASMVMGQNSKKKKPATTEIYTRPQPTRPIHPEIPSANRYRQDKVFLEQADSLYRRETDLDEHQIVKGDVRFRQGGMWMFCDSAYYYPQLNSLDAFGHVKMQQGDTLFVYADKLFYNGDERRARLRCGPSERSVRMINRDVTLTTDSLDYDLNMELGWYACGGHIDDKVNTLTSVYGQYSPSTKEAEFYHDVVLVNNRDGFRMLTDTLFYNTDTHIANIVSPTKIVGENDTILTRTGWYNTASDIAVMNSRSTIIHRDSNNNVTTLEGDSIIYDKATRISKAYSYRAAGKIPAPVVLVDTAHKTTLIGGFAMYNDSTREALASSYPMLMEYSRPDTLFLRADTIMTFIETRMVFPPLPADSMREGRADTEVVMTDTVISDQDSSSMLPPPAIGDSIIDSDSVALSPRIQPVDRDSSEMVPKEFHVARAFHKARFFNQDLQGVADSMVVIEYDSILYMYTKPVVWSGERQVYGNEIQVHFNDSTADWALLPDFGMMGELVEEDFFNQLSGREMKAWFEDKDLRRLDVSGNVQTIFLPQDNDSTYSRLVTAESSFLTMDVSDRRLERLKMWPEVTGSTTPLFLVKKNQHFLPGFQWYEAIRPKREWYGDRWHWADDLGEVSEDLERYFAAPVETPGGRRFSSMPTPVVEAGNAENSALPAEINGQEESVTVFTEEGEIIEQPEAEENPAATGERNSENEESTE